MITMHKSAIAVLVLIVLFIGIIFGMIIGSCNPNDSESDTCDSIPNLCDKYMCKVQYYNNIGSPYDEQRFLEMARNCRIGEGK